MKKIENFDFFRKNCKNGQNRPFWHFLSKMCVGQKFEISAAQRVNVHIFNLNTHSRELFKLHKFSLKEYGLKIK